MLSSLTSQNSSIQEKIEVFYQNNRVDLIHFCGYCTVGVIAVAFTTFSVAKTVFFFLETGFSIRSIPIYLFYGTIDLSGFFYTGYALRSIIEIYKRKKEIDQYA